MRRQVLFSALLMLVLVAEGQRNVQESVYLQLNDQFLITGETLRYAAFCNSEATGKSSDLSKILYVELIDKDNEPVFQHKVNLIDGLGAGDFFVSSLVPTGSYQLLAYTRWMRNFNQYFQSKITIVNPFEQYTLPKDKEKKLEVVFMPESGFLVADQRNVVVAKSNQKVELKGRVTNEEGETEAEFVIEKSGLGRFDIQPKAGSVYRVIVEDSIGNFHFFTLPEISRRKSAIHMITLPGSYEFEILGNPSSETRIFVTDGQNLILEEPAIVGRRYSVSKRDLKTGVYKAGLILNDAELNNRLFYNAANGDLIQEEIAVEKAIYSTREKVSIVLPDSHNGRVSISVRKKDPLSKKGSISDFQSFNRLKKPISTADGNTIDNQLFYAAWKPAGGAERLEEVEFLPEVRGELITGKISPPLSNQLLVYNTIGEDYQLQAATTGENGMFQFQVEQSEQTLDAYVSVMANDSISKIVLNNQFLDEFPTFNYDMPVLDSMEIIRIAQKSVRNQIDNAYFLVKQDSILEPTDWMPIFTNYDYLYELDEYNRFPQMHEHFIEFIPSVVARKNKHKSKIKVILGDYMIDEYPPLLILDGLPVTAESILSFSPYKIKSIGVINKRIYLDDLVSDGLVVFETFEHDLMTFKPAHSQLKTEYQGLQPVKEYLNTSYTEGNQLKSIPDYREQLYWNPNFQIKGKADNEVIFYTSDVTGDFEIIVEGFSSEGKPIKYTGSITVSK